MSLMPKNLIRFKIYFLAAWNIGRIGNILGLIRKFLSGNTGPFFWLENQGAMYMEASMSAVAKVPTGGKSHAAWNADPSIN